ncbi:Glycoside hydrolase family 81 [Macrophomina phaseolina MS6]|uniref:glucan endo-1,3-beta-D-glucosidase n=1 Tax=Macrophomina phaseolina (strain MS6) TaxID=1126212 RepID=K2S4Z5_MACPH|nr:Glycoside hydrolase family 81 [Macrophomina phaseolina MS6]
MAPSKFLSSSQSRQWFSLLRLAQTRKLMGTLLKHTSDIRRYLAIPGRNALLIVSMLPPAARAAATTPLFSLVQRSPRHSSIEPAGNHPVPRKGIVDPVTKPTQTNKFHGNLYLDTRNQTAWTHPYSVAWAQGSGKAGSWGLAVSHIDRDLLVFGNDTAQDSKTFFAAPIGIQSLIISAEELGNGTAMTLDNLEASSVNVNLAPGAGRPPVITYPLVQGMGFVTGIFKGARPKIQSSVLFRKVKGPIAVGGVFKYQVTLRDGKNWLIYAKPDPGYGIPVFKLVDATTLRGPRGWRGIISVAKNPASSGAEETYDKAAGAYPTAMAIKGSVDGTTGKYEFNFVKAGDSSRPLLMFALPHHVESFDVETLSTRTSIEMYTTTKGLAKGFLSDKWTMVEENLSVSMGFAPWTPDRGSIETLSREAACVVNNAAVRELQEDIVGQTNLDSMYFSGKAFAKFAAVIYAVHDLAGNPQLAREGLVRLKKSLAPFIQNTQQNPLVYDTTWRGVVSTAGFSEPLADFGSTYYNDHHFHYGYFVYTAAVIAYLDPSWLSEGTNKAWIDMLVRDYANPVDDGDFPFSRAFDWFHGHSWAKGVFSSIDGKDQESTSEARSFQNYFLMEEDNANQPREMINNKVTGILWENRVAWTTYFGDFWFYKQGIHMIPVHVPSTLIRTKQFVQEEYDIFLSNGAIDTAQEGWRGILYANLALIDADTSYDFFSDPSFNTTYLDGGASRTWYLAYVSALRGH